MDWVKFSSSQVYERPGRPDENKGNDNVVEDCPSISIRPTTTASTSLAPEFCCRSCISPTSFPVSEDSSGQLIISDPLLLSQLLLLPWLCEAPTADCAKLLYMYLTKTSHLSPEHFEGRTFIIHKSITDVTTSSKFSSVRF